VKGWAAACAEGASRQRGNGPSFRAGLEAQIVMAAIERSAATGETVAIGAA
jgi:predicted dehydrogenase